MACNTFGWIPVVSTNQTILSSRRLSTLCFAGTVKLLGAMYIFRMFQTLTSTVEPAFPDSRWFKRGWTLQELIAPSSVQFFSRKGELLGNKKSREQQIHQI